MCLCISYRSQCVISVNLRVIISHTKCHILHNGRSHVLCCHKSNWGSNCVKVTDWPAVIIAACDWLNEESTQFFAFLSFGGNRRRRYWKGRAKRAHSKSDNKTFYGIFPKYRPCSSCSQQTQTNGDHWELVKRHTFCHQKVNLSWLTHGLQCRSVISTSKFHVHFASIS